VQPQPGGFEVTRRTKFESGSDKTLRAAKAFSRRTLLKSAAAAGAVAALAPYYLSAEARAASGELKILIWSGYVPDPAKEKFEADTGVTLQLTYFGSNEELLNKLKATKGRGFDLVSPTLNREPQWSPLGLLQPFDMNKVPTDRILPGLLKGSTDAWTWDGQNYHLPYLWGTEALSWRTDKWQREYKDLTYGDLWLPEMKGFIQGRPHSMMAGIGLYLDRIGQLPSNRMLDAYKDEENMRRIWGEITKFAVEHKPWIKQFWDDHDTQKAGLMQNGVILGQTWDGPPLELKKAGEPVTYMAPQEGAFTWLDGLSIPIGAENMDGIYAFLDVLYTPEVGGLLGNHTGYNAVSVGASDHLDEASKKAFEEAYPEDALDKLWWWPAEPVWYAAARSEFRDQFVAA
jgi:spermidine/putrescine transport system substrate-binding protein